MKLKAFLFPNYESPIPSIRDIQATESRRKKAKELRETISSRSRPAPLNMNLEPIK